jgi:hypothetical protein
MVGRSVEQFVRRRPLPRPAPHVDDTDDLVGVVDREEDAIDVRPACVPEHSDQGSSSMLSGATGPPCTMLSLAGAIRYGERHFPRDIYSAC